MRKEETIIDKLTSNPYFMELTKEEYQIMQQDEDLKGKVFDFREKLNAKRLSDGQFEYLEKRKQQTELQQTFNDLGGFVFLVYQKLSVMFDDSILSLEDKSRILLLSTYISYDTNRLTYPNNKPIRKEALSGLLRVSERTVRRFLEKTINLGLIEIIKDEIYLSRNLFFKGESRHVKQIKDIDFSYTRLFINTYQYLYENIPKAQQRYLGVIYTLIPYINFHHNYLVNSNPQECDVEKLDVMTFDQMLDICGYKKDMAASTKSNLKRTLLNLSLENGTPLFALVKTKDTTKILVNPYITYSSSNHDSWNSTLEVIFKYRN